jgi:hypothetical protein
MNSISLEFDSSPFLAVVNRLSAELFDLPLEIVERLFDLFHSATDLVRFESASAAGTLKITLYPAERFLDFAATTRAGQIDLGALV